MAGQAPSRRQLLQALACAAFASGARGFSRWSYAFAEAEGEHARHQAAAVSRAPQRAYRPRFFSPAEFATVVVLAELILPRTAGEGTSALGSRVPHRQALPRRSAVKPAEAGATDAGVAEFIDFMVSQEPALRTAFRTGLMWMDAEGAVPFRTRPPAEQTSVLERIAYRKNFREEDKVGQEFFLVLRRYTVMGFYTSRIGLESLNFPGLQFYASSPSVPVDDPLRKMGA